MPIQRFDCGPRMSEMVVHNDTVYLCGQIADFDAMGEVSTDVEAQTRDVLRQIDTLLARAGTDKSKLLTATVYLADMGGFAAMNTAWDAWVDRANAPARATVEAKLAAPEYRVEIQVVAAL
ncbi:RidA family protein [Roseomonas genomospecies 6]|nr:RidA family protein [Roseomonas genomospecies 6]